MKPVLEVFLIFLRLGCTSFGGPVAHLGYFHNEFVVRKQWLSEESYAELIALCQFLPGPSSSQVGIALGFSRAGYSGAFAAWLGFTLPSAILLVLFALGLNHLQINPQVGWLHGVKIAAVAIVAQAIWLLGKQLCPDIPRKGIALAAAVLAGFLPTAMAQITILFLAAGAGLGLLQRKAQTHSPLEFFAQGAKRNGTWFLVTFFSLLAFLPLAASVWEIHALHLVDSFYRAGSLVFGGGHVVLPLLQREVVPPGWITNDQFFIGYGAAQAVPGPLFTFAAYLGAVLRGQPTGWAGAALCLLAVFLPAFLLVLGTLPFWERVRKNKSARAALLGINAGVVGLLLAAFYNPIWPSAIFSWRDLLLAIAAGFCLFVWKAPSWLVVLGCAVIGWFVL